VRRRQRGQVLIGLAVAIGFLALIGLLAVCTPGENDHSLGRLEFVSHDYECQSHECGGGDGDNWGGGSDGNSGGDYEGGRSGDNDQRGDHNCRNFCFYGVPLPGQQQPQSLFPPTPAGIRDFVLAVMKSGIEMGRLFADTTITFVSNLLVGLA
jgi:hypothetical protein